jgi:hypothetical protein
VLPDGDDVGVLLATDATRLEALVLRAFSDASASQRPRAATVGATICEASRAPRASGATDVRVGAGVLDSAIPVDPGAYHIVVRAPGYLAWETDLNIAEGERRLVSIPELQPSVPSAAPLPAAPPQAAPAPVQQLPKPPTPRRAVQAATRRSQTWAWALGGGGIVSLAVGGVFGVRTFTSYAEARLDCPSHAGCSSTAMAAWRTARTSAWREPTTSSQPLGRGTYCARCTSHPAPTGQCAELLALTPGSR